MRRFAALAVGFSIGQILAGSALGWYYVFVLRRYDPKFSRAPIAAFEIHRDVSIVLALVGVGAIGLLLALRGRRSSGLFLRPLRGAVMALALGLLSAGLHFLHLELVHRWGAPAHLIWIPPILCGAASVGLDVVCSRRAVVQE